MKRSLFIILVTLFAIVFAACQSGQGSSPTGTPAPTKPTVIINSPASNATMQNGAQVQVQSTSADTAGIVLVELIVDGQTVQNSPTPNGQPQAQFSVIQNWTPTANGTHNITVRATNAKLATGEANITVDVEQTVAENSPTAPPTLVINPSPVIPTTTPLAPTNTPAPVPPATCTLGSTFISDVTVPDGTVIAPGASFVKTWAIQNSGTCTWGGGYTVALVGGESFGASSPQPIGSANPGDVINISVNMAAPAPAGGHSSIWQVVASNGVAFGTKFDAVINVPGAPTQVPPTPIPPTPIPPSVCNGTPVVTNFFANPQTLSPGQTTTLQWGLVQNANAVYLITPSGTQAVASPGSIQLQPSQTTTYTLTAYCNNNPIQVQATVTVQSGGGGCQGTPFFNGFYASPQTISSGQGSTLNWGLVQNANAVYLQLPNQTIGVSTPGSRNVNPGSTTTYTLVAYCGNNQASIQTTINVNGSCNGAPNFNGFTANPNTIQKGQSSTLRWGIVTNATSVQLQTPDGTGGVATPNSLVVKPRSTTTYTLIAYCNNTKRQLSVTVTVQGPPQPTPTPTPKPPAPNAVNSIQVQQFPNKRWRLTIVYTWNGSNAPALMSAEGSRGGLIATNASTAAIVAGGTRTTFTNVYNNGIGKPDKFQACIVGKGGNDLACRSVPAP